MACIQQSEILPYDKDGFLNKIVSFGADDWEKYYVEEALLCYNAGAYSAATMMIGLCGEYIAEKLVTAMEDFLNSKEATLYQSFTSSFRPQDKIFKKYKEYEAMLEQLYKSNNVNRVGTYPTLIQLRPRYDQNAYTKFLQLTRNEAGHPSGIKFTRLDCLTLFVSFTKYYETQQLYLAELIRLK